MRPLRLPQCVPRTSAKFYHFLYLRSLENVLKTLPEPLKASNNNQEASPLEELLKFATNVMNLVISLEIVLKMEEEVTDNNSNKVVTEEDTVEATEVSNNREVSVEVTEENLRTVTPVGVLVTELRTVPLHLSVSTVEELVNTLFNSAC